MTGSEGQNDRYSKISSKARVTISRWRQEYLLWPMFACVPGSLRPPALYLSSCVLNTTQVCLLQQPTECPMLDEFEHAGSRGPLPASTWGGCAGMGLHAGPWMNLA